MLTYVVCKSSSIFSHRLFKPPGWTITIGRLNEYVTYWKIFGEPRFIFFHKICIKFEILCLKSSFVLSCSYMYACLDEYSLCRETQCEIHYLVKELIYMYVCCSPKKYYLTVILNDIQFLSTYNLSPIMYMLSHASKNNLNCRFCTGRTKKKIRIALGIKN